MAISKVILNGNTLMDTTDKTVTAANLLSGYTALKNDGTTVTGEYIVPTPSFQSKTVSPSTSQQTVSPDSGYDGLSQVTVNAMPSGTAGTPTATKGTVSNHSVSVTPSVTNTTGYITGGTKNGTAVTVSASELVSGTKSITENGTGIDVANYASVDVNVSGGGVNNVVVSLSQLYNTFNNIIIPKDSVMEVDSDEPWITRITTAENSLIVCIGASSFTPTMSGGITYSELTFGARPQYHAYSFYVSDQDGTIEI